MEREKNIRFYNWLGGDKLSNYETMIDKMSITYVQEKDCESTSECDNKMTLELNPEGFVTFSTNRWAIELEHIDELVRVFEDFKMRVATETSQSEDITFLNKKLKFLKEKYPSQEWIKPDFRDETSYIIYVPDEIYKLDTYIIDENNIMEEFLKMTKETKTLAFVKNSSKI
jgi:hypothetical protein